MDTADAHSKPFIMQRNGKFKEQKTMRRENKEKEGKIIATIGFIVHLIFVAIPNDIHLWLTRRRKNVAGQTIVITGGGSGIGQRMAEIFALELGACVAIIDIDLAKAESVAKSIREKRGNAVAFKSDVTCPNSMELCANAIKSTFGRVDIVICNAAILFFAQTLKLTSDQLQQAYNVNVLGVLHTIRAFLPDFESENRGQIVTMSSIAGFYGETYGIAYCPTKFAVRGIMECLEMELRDRGLDGIKCTTLCPYFVRTPMILNMGMRPTSRFISFMSIDRCCSRAIDAILKEKVLCFIPGYIYIMAMIKNLMTQHIRIAARNWLNCRYVPIETEKTASGLGNSVATDNNQIQNSPVLSVAANEQTLRPEMVNYFRSPSLFWFVVIPVGLAAVFITYWNPEWIPRKYTSIFGDFAYFIGTEYNWVSGLICIGALIAHIGEGTYAIQIADSLGFTHACSLKWFIQTFIFGYPSLRLLLAYKKERAIKRKK